MPPNPGHRRRSWARSVRKSPFCTSDLHNFWASKLHAHLVWTLCKWATLVPSLFNPLLNSPKDPGLRTKDSGVRACRHAVNEAPSTVPVINPCLWHFPFSLFIPIFTFVWSFWQFRKSGPLMQMRVHPHPLFAKWKSYANFPACGKLLPPRDARSAWSPLWFGCWVSGTASILPRSFLAAIVRKLENLHNFSWKFCRLRDRCKDSRDRRSYINDLRSQVPFPIRLLFLLVCVNDFL